MRRCLRWIVTRTVSFLANVYVAPVQSERGANYVILWRAAVIHLPAGCSIALTFPVSIYALSLRLAQVAAFLSKPRLRVIVHAPRTITRSGVERYCAANVVATHFTKSGIHAKWDSSLLIFVSAGNKERQRRSSGNGYPVFYVVAGTSLRLFAAYKCASHRKSTGC